MCCSNALLLQTDYHTLLCTECGRETPSFGSIYKINQSYSQSLYPFSQCYSRKKRFREMVENIFFPCLSTLDNTICANIASEKICSVQELFLLLKSLKVKDKRYGSIHALTRQFVENYLPPKPVSSYLVDEMCTMFSEIELVYTRFFGKAQFFNYSWLILKFLFVFELDDYTPYVKPLKCKRRIEVYEEKLKKVMRELARLNISPGLVGALLNSR